MGRIGRHDPFGKRVIPFTEIIQPSAVVARNEALA
jgi:hypothetical protein